MKNKNTKGFTLVEIIVVLVILAILAAAAIPSMIGFVDKAHEKSAYNELREIAVASQCAYSEVYGSNQLNKNTQILYVKGISSAQEIDHIFERNFKKYLKDDINTDDIRSISVIGNNMTIYYFKDGQQYCYLKRADKITIEKVNYPTE